MAAGSQMRQNRHPALTIVSKAPKSNGLVSNNPYSAVRSRPDEFEKTVDQDRTLTRGTELPQNQDSL